LGGEFQSKIFLEYFPSPTQRIKTWNYLTSSDAPDLFVEEGAEGTIDGVMEHDGGGFGGEGVGGSVPGTRFSCGRELVISQLSLPIVGSALNLRYLIFGNETDVGHAIGIVAEEEDEDVTGTGELVAHGFEAQVHHVFGMMPEG